MEQMDRSTFMKLAGAGSVAAAVPMAGKLAAQDDSRLQFKALGGLPKAPLPSYATHVVEGTVDLTTGTGIVTTRVLAGHPGGTSGVGLPGLARDMREVARFARISDLDDRGAVILLAAGERVQRLAAVVTDVGDPAPAAFLDDRLVGAAALQVVVSDERHV